MSNRPGVPPPIPGSTRRRVLAALGLGSLAGAAPIEVRGADGHSEYLFTPGLTYLNTAALGPTTRAVLERTLEAWRELESNTVFMGYDQGPAHIAADRVRTADEILITRGTTDAMNALAQWMRLRRGDRVLLRDQEHDGGSVCWRYRARRDGLHADVVPIAPTDHDASAIVDRLAAAITRLTKVISITLREKHGVVIKRIEERWFNGIRFSPHVFNTEADVDAALAALRTERELGGAA